MTDIDISHRLKKTQKGKRDVIVKFNSGMVKLQILRKKKDVERFWFIHQ